MFLPSKVTADEGIVRRKAVSAVTNWVTARLETNDPQFHPTKYQVMVTEIQCNDPGCVPIESLVVIVLLDDTLKEHETIESARRTRWADKILKPVAEVTESDAMELIDRILPKPEVAIKPAVSSIETAIAAMQITRVVMKPNTQPKSQADAVGSSVKNVNVNISSSTAVVPTTTMSEAMVPSSSAQATHSSAAISPSLPIPPSVPPAATIRPTPPTPPVTIVNGPGNSTIAPRHEKGSTRPRGCPCCDPDNLDNIVDSLLFSHYAPT